MHISAISTMNFYGQKTAVKNTARTMGKDVEKFINEALKPKDDFVNFNQSAYSIPTGEYPYTNNALRRHPYSPEDSVISNEYIKIKETLPAKVEEAIDFVSDGAILK